METGSVTAAGERISISQPSVSKHLKLLEHAIGFELFTRTGNKLLPNPEAQALFEQIDRSYRGLEHVARFAAGLKDHPSGEISVAAMPMLAHEWLPDILADFLARRERLSIAFPVRSSRWIADAIAAGQVDLGIGLKVGDDPSVETEIIMQIPLVCAFQNGDALSGREVVTVADLSGETLISLTNFDHWRLSVETALEAHKVMPARRVDTFTTHVACELARRGVGIAIVDAVTARSYHRQGLTMRRFEPASIFQIVLMRSKHRAQPRLALELADAIRLAASNTSKSISSDFG
jgi:DNA-binding transcriptional LysR family regulator